MRFRRETIEKQIIKAALDLGDVGAQPESVFS